MKTRFPLFVLRHPEDYYSPSRTDRMIDAMFNDDKGAKPRSWTGFLWTCVILAMFFIAAYLIMTECRLPFRDCPTTEDTQPTRSPAQEKSTATRLV